MTKMILMAAGNNQFNPKIMGKIINLLRNEPLVIAQSTGNSLEERKPVAFFGVYSQVVS